MLIGQKPLPPPPGDPSPSGDTAAQLLAAWEAAAPDIVSTAILLARRGDIAALRLILERIAPVARGRSLSLNLPELRTVSDIPAINAKLVQFVAAGDITAEEASAMSAILQNYVDAVAAVEHEARIAALENRTR